MFKIGSCIAPSANLFINPELIDRYQSATIDFFIKKKLISKSITVLYFIRIHRIVKLKIEDDRPNKPFKYIEKIMKNKFILKLF